MNEDQKPSNLWKELRKPIAALFTPIIAVSIIVLAAKLVNEYHIDMIIKENEQTIILIIAFTAASSTFFLVPQFLTKFRRNDTVSHTFSEPHFATGAEIIKIAGRKNEDKKSVNDYEEFLLILIPLEQHINSHINRLQNNSTLNLVIGIVGSIISIFILSTALISNHNYKSFDELLLYLIPRLSFTILTQLFAFFFLRLYKTNLEDSKYFQNELTNVISKTAALKIAFHQSDKALIIELARDLSKVERNFKLSAGETLLNIEKSKIDKADEIEILNLVKEFIKNIKPNSQ